MGARLPLPASGVCWNVCRVCLFVLTVCLPALLTVSSAFGSGQEAVPPEPAASVEKPAPGTAAEASAPVKAAAEAPAEPASAPLHSEIDRLIAARWQADGVTPAPRSSDAEFVRRIHLDLIGRIPNADEVRAFLHDESPDRRTVLIDRLLATPDYARHMQHLFDAMLMRRLPQKNVAVAEWQAWLRQSFAENKPWDRMTRELLATDGADAKQRGPARFYLDRDGEVNAITRDIGRMFLGADLECAQCHNHPEVDDYRQEHYYGIAAFLTRSFLFTGKDKKAVFAEKAEGEATFKSVFTPDEPERSAKPRIFDGMILQEASFAKGEEYEVKPAKDVRPVPKFSRRQHLADAIASPDNPRFARTIANRVWALLLGRGLIEPVDRDHSGNPPSHPELLDLLSRELTAHEFDLKWLIREVVLSETYQRSSRLDDPAAAVPEDSFAQFPLKPLTPEQFAWSVLEATGETAVHRAALGEKLTEETLNARLISYENRFVQLFGGQPGQPPENYESTMEQVLFLANNSLINNLLPAKNGNTTGRLLALQPDDPGPVIDELFLSVLSRPATEDDRRPFAEILQSTPADARPAVVQELLWALLTSAEFRFNH